MSEQVGFDFISAPAYRQVARKEFVLRTTLEHGEHLRPDFYEWLKANYAIWERFEREANAIWRAGRKHYSQRTIWEVMRHETALREVDPTFKLNDKWVKSLAHLYLALNRDKPGFFETRERH